MATAVDDSHGEDEAKIVCGYLNKIESLGKPLCGCLRSFQDLKSVLFAGVIKTARKRWYVLGFRSHYLYAYKNPRDALPVAEIDVAAAVFTCDAVNPKAFQIKYVIFFFHSGTA